MHHTIAATCEADPRPVGIVATCGWAHTHSADDLCGLHTKAAANDGLWQTLILAGALERVPMAPDVLCYEAPSYYGMLVAWFGRGDG